MAKFMYYPATKLFYNIPPNIDNLNHDKQEFVRHWFRSANYAQPHSAQEPAFIKIPKKTFHAKNLITLKSFLKIVHA
jgi:hypothetical protein